MWVTTPLSLTLLHVSPTLSARFQFPWNHEWVPLIGDRDGECFSNCNDRGAFEGLELEVDGIVRLKDQSFGEVALPPGPPAALLLVGPVLRLELKRALIGAKSDCTLGYPGKRFSKASINAIVEHPPKTELVVNSSCVGK